MLERSINSQYGECSETEGGTLRTIRFFSELQHQYEDAATRRGVVRHSFLIGGRKVDLIFAGSEMIAPLTRPLMQHVSDFEAAVGESEGPVLKVLVWDNSSTQTPILKTPWALDEFTPIGQVIPCRTGRFRAVYEADGGLLSMIDLEQHTAIYNARDYKDIPSHILGTPLRAILSAWFETAGSAFVHAACVGDGQSGVLIAGNGGAGKSSSALSCLHADFKYLSDDYCLVNVHQKPRAYNIYSSAKVFEADVPRYPLLRDCPESLQCEDSNKTLFFLYSSFKQQIGSCVTLKALLLPRIGGGETMLQSISPQQTFLSIAKSSSTLFPYSPAQPLRIIAELSRQVPAYVLNLGPDRSDVARIVSQLLKVVPASEV